MIVNDKSGKFPKKWIQSSIAFFYSLANSKRAIYFVSFLVMVLPKATPKWVRLLAAQKPINSQVGGKERLIYFRCWQLVGGGWQTSVQRLTPLTLPPHQPPALASSEVRAFTDRRRGLYAETAQSALTVIFRLVVSGLTGIILVVLGTVNLQFEGRFVSITLRRILRIVAAQVLGTVWSSCS